MAKLPNITGAGGVTDANVSVVQQETNFQNWLQFLIDLFGSANDSVTQRALVTDTLLGTSAAITAAATTDLSTVPTARLVTINQAGAGAVAISSFGNVAANAERVLTVNLTGTGALTLVAGANLLIPGVASGNSLTLYDKDAIDIVSLGGSVWKVRKIGRYNWSGDPLRGFCSKVRNGRMDVVQRGTSIAAANGYTLDGWFYGGSGAQVATVSQQPWTMAGSEMQSCLQVQVTTANAAPAAGDVAYVYQPIEGFLVRDLLGNPIGIRFEVSSPKAGTHCLVLRNSGLDRSYILTYSVAATNTPQLITLALPGGLISAGTWNWTTGVGVQIAFVLMAGTGWQNTAGSWLTGNYLSTSAQVNCMDTVGNLFKVTGVQVEKGPSTPFEHRSIADELQLNQRYGRPVYGGAIVGQVLSTTTILFAVPGNGVMRAPPTVTLTKTSWAAASFELLVGGAWVSNAAASISVNSVTADGLTFTMNGFSGLTVGQMAIMNTSGQVLFLSSEL